MRQLKVILAVFFVSLSLYSYANETDSLLRVLDMSIRNRPQYTLERQEQIDALQRKLRLPHSDQERFDVYRELFGKYRSYRMDSALWVANQRVELAKRMKNPLHIYSAELNVAEVMIGVAMYKEGLEILDGIKSSDLDASVISYYYYQYHQVYTLMADYAFSDKMKDHYRSLAYQYKDSILNIRKPGSQGYLLMKSEKLLYEEKYDEAIGILNSCYETHKQKGYSVAIPSIGLANAYGVMGKTELQKKYLIISAIADIQAATKEYISLWKLANLLFQEGDINRAYTYIECSMQDATFCNARYRTQEISEMLPIISRTYENKLRQEKTQMVALFVLTSVLLIILLIALMFIFYQMKRLNVARKAVSDMNEELKHINANLHTLNDKLQESNQVKEEYIGYVFNMCSLYINKQEEQRKMLARKIKTGQLDDLYKTVNSSSFVANELKEFFYTFDSVFLKLYPKFIEQFNTLLQEDERICPKEGELLTPELRVFALIRLGITDSGKIANFLHYSAQTVYNYRLKVRNKSLLSKDEFMEAVQQIG